jgi:hypothetical protein
MKPKRTPIKQRSEKFMRVKFLAKGGTLIEVGVVDTTLDGVYIPMPDAVRLNGSWFVAACKEESEMLENQKMFTSLGNNKINSLIEACKMEELIIENAIEHYKVKCREILQSEMEKVIPFMPRISGLDGIKRKTKPKVKTT